MKPTTPFSVCKHFCAGSEGGNAVVDQSYDPQSENAQSGKAVAEAVKDKVDVKEIVRSVEDVDKSKLQIPSVGYVDDQVSGSIFSYHESITAYAIDEGSDELIPTTKAVADYVNTAIGEALEGDY